MEVHKNKVTYNLKAETGAGVGLLNIVIAVESCFRCSGVDYV
jgi:hypothetical protein